MTTNKKRTMLDKILNQPADYDKFDDTKAAEVQALIDAGKLDEAQKKLSYLYGSESASDYRNHRSYYLQGQIEYKRGWLQDAYNSYKKAYEEQSQNPKYAEAFALISEQRNRNQQAFAPSKTKSSCCDCGHICDCCTGDL